MKRHWLFLLLWCLPNWLYAHEILDNFLQDLETLLAQFEQELYNEKGVSLEESSQGRMHMQRPDKFRWEYQKPYVQLIVADGKKVWVYDKDLEQVTVRSMDKALGKTPALILSSNRKIEEDFLVKKLPSPRGYTRFELVPKDKEEAQFDSMYINVDGKVLLSLELVDNLGQTTVIFFNKVRRNHKLKPMLFKFTPPAGVDIIKDE
jgi:outer membrane lipoprotein carrier protein